ncbi:MAG: adenylate/guanylate cyclase domain-containing protein [Pseudomonadota bacterium]
MPDVFDEISDWLLERSLQDLDLSDTVTGFCARLMRAGIAVDRLRIGRVVLHPEIGLLDLTWASDAPGVAWTVVRRDQIDAAAISPTPFGEAMVQDLKKLVADLRDPADVARYPIFETLAAEGITSYALFRHRFGRDQTALPALPSGAIGTILAFATRRFSGFSQTEIAQLERLSRPLAVCVRVATERYLATELLETYLGRNSGRRVLNGQSTRGDWQQIECALFYSDMRSSTALSQSLEAPVYLDLLNSYFDCTAQAALDHGGEVLKYIGDGLLAIFPCAAGTDARRHACASALAAARDAAQRARSANADRDRAGAPTFDYAVALHIGQVLYGNIGTRKRLDFTATGPSVALVSRLEGLSTELGAPLLASDAFAAACPGAGHPIGTRTLRGFDAPMALTAYDLTLD